MAEPSVLLERLQALIAAKGKGTGLLLPQLELMYAVTYGHQPALDLPAGVSLLEHVKSHGAFLIEGTKITLQQPEEPEPTEPARDAPLARRPSSQSASDAPAPSPTPAQCLDLGRALDSAQPLPSGFDAWEEEEDDVPRCPGKSPSAGLGKGIVHINSLYAEKSRIERERAAQAERARARERERLLEAALERERLESLARERVLAQPPMPPRGISPALCAHAQPFAPAAYDYDYDAAAYGYEVDACDPMSGYVSTTSSMLSGKSPQMRSDAPPFEPAALQLSPQEAYEMEADPYAYPGYQGYAEPEPPLCQALLQRGLERERDRLEQDLGLSPSLQEVVGQAGRKASSQASEVPPAPPRPDLAETLKSLSPVDIAPSSAASEAERFPRLPDLATMAALPADALPPPPTLPPPLLGTPPAGPRAAPAMPPPSMPLGMPPPPSMPPPPWEPPEKEPGADGVEGSSTKSTHAPFSESAALDEEKRTCGEEEWKRCEETGQLYASYPRGRLLHCRCAARAETSLGLSAKPVGSLMLEALQSDEVKKEVKPKVKQEEPKSPERSAKREEKKEAKSPSREKREKRKEKEREKKAEAKKAEKAGEDEKLAGPVPEMPDMLEKPDAEAEFASPKRKKKRSRDKKKEREREGQAGDRGQSEEREPREPREASEPRGASEPREPEEPHSPLPNASGEPKSSPKSERRSKRGGKKKRGGDRGKGDADKAADGEKSLETPAPKRDVSPSDGAARAISQAPWAKKEKERD